MLPAAVIASAVPCALLLVVAMSAYFYQDSNPWLNSYGWRDALRVGADIWALGYSAPLHISAWATTISVVPLLLTLFYVRLGAGVARWLLPRGSVGALWGYPLFQAAVVSGACSFMSGSYERWQVVCGATVCGALSALWALKLVDGRARRVARLEEAYDRQLSRRSALMRFQAVARAEDSLARAEGAREDAYARSGEEAQRVEAAPASPLSGSASQVETAAQEEAKSTPLSASTSAKTQTPKNIEARWGRGKGGSRRPQSTPGEQMLARVKAQARGKTPRPAPRGARGSKFTNFTKLQLFVRVRLELLREFFTSCAHLDYSYSRDLRLSRAGEDHNARSWENRKHRWLISGWVIDGLYGAWGCFLALAWGSLALLAGRLQWVWEDYSARLAALPGTGNAPLGMSIAQAVFVPDMQVWALGWVSGAGFVAGEDTFYSTLQAQPGLLPAIPAFALLPSSPAGAWPLVLLVMCGALGGAFYYQRRARVSFPQYLASLALALGGCAALVILCAWAASGAAGPGRLSVFGVRPLALVGLLLLELGVPFLLVAAALHPAARARTRKLCGLPAAREHLAPAPVPSTPPSPAQSTPAAPTAEETAETVAPTGKHEVSTADLPVAPHSAPLPAPDETAPSSLPTSEAPRLTPTETDSDSPTLSSVSLAAAPETTGSLPVAETERECEPVATPNTAAPRRSAFARPATPASKPPVAPPPTPTSSPEQQRLAELLKDLPDTGDLPTGISPSAPAPLPGRGALGDEETSGEIKRLDTGSLPSGEMARPPVKRTLFKAQRLQAGTPETGADDRHTQALPIQENP